MQQAEQQVSARLGRAARATPPLVAQISEESFARTRSDPRTLAVFSKWSACMSAHGYSYSNPFQPAASVNQSATPTQTEIQTAMTDVACKRKTNLLGITYAVQADYQNDIDRQVRAGARPDKDTGGAASPGYRLAGREDRQRRLVRNRELQGTQIPAEGLYDETAA